MASQQSATVGPGTSFSLFPNTQTSRPPASVIRLHPNPRPKCSESRERARKEQQQLQNSQTQNQQVQQKNQQQPSTQNSSSDIGPASSDPQQHTTQQLAHTPLQFDPVPPNTCSISSFQVQKAQKVAELSGPSVSTSSIVNTSSGDTSAQSRKSISKAPLNGLSSSTPLSSQSMLPHSIFPTYNPDVSLDQQAYGPTLISRPSHIPRAIMSRQSYFDSDAVSVRRSSQAPLPEVPCSPPVLHQRQNTATYSASTHRPTPSSVSSLPVIPKTSTTEQLKTFWKAANGWKAAPSEGRVFCLKLTQLKDALVYTLSSASQPFYSLRVDPTSASALVSLSRHDPGKTFKPPKTDSCWSSSSLSSISSSTPLPANAKADIDVRTGNSKHWQQVLHTAIEEESYRQPLSDGLVALLMPEQAARMATERADEPTLVSVAERERARLEWRHEPSDDHDSAGHYYLVHPAAAVPFRVAIERRPAWSRVEYTLEHHESARHLAKLTRDGTGRGWLEVDTSVASQIDSYYIIDVAVVTLMIVAVADERSGQHSSAGNARGMSGGAGGIGTASTGMETFEPPPPAPTEAATRRESKTVRRFSILGWKGEVKKYARRQRRRRGQRQPMEEFEIDVESQDGGSLDKVGSTRVRSKEEETKDKLPFLLRVGVGMTKGMFKCFIWMLTAIFRVASRCFQAKN